MHSFKTLAFTLLLAISGVAVARNTIVNIPLLEVLDMPEAKSKLDGSVRYFLQGQPTPQVISRFGVTISNPKTNGANKGDRQACKWAALSALVNFQAAARAQGQDANAVVDLVSYYKKVVKSSATDIECHAGAIIVGVALKGTFAKIAK